MGILRYIILILSALIFTSCYETFEPDFNQKPMLCLNSVIKAGEPIELQISHTWHYSDYDGLFDHSISDAQYRIFANGGEVDSDYIPKEGDWIKILALSEKYGEAEAEVIVPFRPSVNQIQYKLIPLSLNNGDNEDYKMDFSLDFNLELKVEISDAGNTEDYYHISFKDYSYLWSTSEKKDEIIPGYEKPYILYDGGILDYNSEPLFFENAEEMESIYGSPLGFTFFTDRNFSGNSYTLNPLFSSCRYIVKSEVMNPDLLDCGKEVTLHKVSKSYYDFEYYSLYVEYGVLGNLSDWGYLDPIWGYSNVSTGAGIVMAESTITFKISLKDELEKIMSSLKD